MGFISWLKSLKVFFLEPDEEYPLFEVEGGQKDKTDRKEDQKRLKVRREIIKDLGKTGQKKRPVGRPRKEKNG